MGISNDRAIGVDAAAGLAARREAKEQRHLFGPVADFLCLGGASLLLFPIVFALPEEEFLPAFGAVFFVVS